MGILLILITITVTTAPHHRLPKLMKKMNGNATLTYLSAALDSVMPTEANERNVSCTTV